ncbi:MAG: rod shape-determining protein RodA [Rhodospirillales bacterium]|nr:rod shape-determining protein RodA [Rhodospirillales bacterium]MCB9965519.1 rod shape-determining protein RodA [Rhodospirillales bacterium]MCB9980695.1 rod shape-determining protein RodA [Rhodospirillales bacterium]
MPPLNALKDPHDWLYRLKQINLGLIILICGFAGIGFLALYSAGSGDVDKWAASHMMRFGVGFVAMLVICLIDIRWWYRLSYPFYVIGLLLLVFVEIKGHTGMGAQRWINLGFMVLQPSELMKIAVVMALARYFQAIGTDDIKGLKVLITPAILVALPVGLVLLQPDLGTALMICMAAAAMFFIAGTTIWLFIIGIGGGIAAIPIAWQFLHDYQKQRVLTFMEPERDPLGAGYHITQSKIAIGSGGIEGKGFMQGTQSHLNFLPEKQTDFIFTLWVEETGFLGGMAILLLLLAIFAYGYWISFRCKHAYGRLLSLGLTVNFALYAFINIAMVMGLIPVVGAPLPLVSYGGTAMLAAMIGFGLVICCNVYRDSKLVRM